MQDSLAIGVVRKTEVGGRVGAPQRRKADSNTVALRCTARIACRISGQSRDSR